MGNSSSSSTSNPAEKSNKEFLKDLKVNLEVEQTTRDPRFGNIKICHHRANPKIRVFLLTKTPTEDEYERLTLELNERQINHPNLLTIYGFDNESSGVCSSSGKATLFVEWQKHNLEKELDRRAEKAHFLSEQEVWYLLDALISALIALENKKVFHGDIEPHNVFITEEGYVKLADHGLISELKTGYNRAVLGGEVALLSPELLNFYREKDMRPVYDEMKADIFGIGMTLLHSGCLKNSKSLYDMRSGTIYVNEVLFRLQEIERRYSQFLVSVIKKMLLDEPVRRPGLNEIHDILIPFQSSIRSLEGFDPRTTHVPIPSQLLPENTNQYQFRPQHDPNLPTNILPRVDAPMSPTRQVQVKFQQNAGVKFQSPRPISPPRNINNQVPVQTPIYMTSQVVTQQPIYSKIPSGITQSPILINENLPFSPSRNHSAANLNLHTPLVSETYKIENRAMIQTPQQYTSIQQQVLPEISVPSQTLYSAPTPIKHEFIPTSDGNSYHVIYNSPQRTSNSKFEEANMRFNELSPVNPNPLISERSVGRNSDTSSDKVYIATSANKESREALINPGQNMSLDERIELALKSSEKMLKKNQDFTNVSNF